MAKKALSSCDLHDSFVASSNTSFCACLTNAHAARWAPAEWPAKNTLLTLTNTYQSLTAAQRKEMVWRLPKLYLCTNITFARWSIPVFGSFITLIQFCASINILSERANPITPVKRGFFCALTCLDHHQGLWYSDKHSLFQ
jgi:hypothetical protein